MTSYEEFQVNIQAAYLGSTREAALASLNKLFGFYGIPVAYQLKKVTIADDGESTVETVRAPWPDAEIPPLGYVLLLNGKEIAETFAATREAARALSREHLLNHMGHADEISARIAIVPVNYGREIR
jgi:hypothetical protein